MSPQWWPRILTTWWVLGLCVVRKRSGSWSTDQSWVFLEPEWVVQVQRLSPSVSTWNFLQPKTFCGIWAPIDVKKNVCQRLVDQDSSLRWGLICPNQLIGLKKRKRLGESSSWDSRLVISIRSTDSSAVTTTRCCERKVNCSAWRKPTNFSLRSRKGCQWTRIC